jgi:hypothetical protein
VALDRVQPLKLEDTATGGDEVDAYPTAIDKNEDFIDCRGLVLQKATGDDENVTIDRDTADNLRFKDAVTGTKTLADLAAAAGLSMYDFLLDCEPDAVTNDYAVSRTGGVVTNETWTNRSTSKTIKTIDYARTGGFVTTETRKLYGADGATVVAQLTIVYSRTGGNVDSATYTRDI